MPLHLIKLCVGCDSVRDLQGWIRERLKDKRKRGEKPEHIHRTRMVPKRAEELTDGGSLFWVIRGVVRKGEEHYGHTIVGYRHGWRGVVEGESIEMTVASVRGLLPRAVQAIRTPSADRVY